MTYEKRVNLEFNSHCFLNECFNERGSYDNQIS